MQATAPCTPHTLGPHASGSRLAAGPGTAQACKLSGQTPRCRLPVWVCYAFGFAPFVVLSLKEPVFAVPTQTHRLFFHTQAHQGCMQASNRRTQRRDGLHERAHARRAPAPLSHEPVRQDAGCQAHRRRCLQGVTRFQAFCIQGLSRPVRHIHLLATHVSAGKLLQEKSRGHLGVHILCHRDSW